MASNTPPDTRRPAGGALGRLADIVTGDRSKWLVLAFWVAIVAALSPFAGRLSEVEENDAGAFLPEGAESLQVAELQERFADGETLAAVIVYQRDGGLNADDRAAIEADRQALAERFPAAPLGPPVPSEDGEALLYALTLPEDDEELTDHIEDIRDLVGGERAGLNVSVTGPAGFITDLVAVFGGIDSTLLIATATVVTIILLLTYRSPFLWIVPLLVVAFANQTATAAVYGLARSIDLAVDGQSAGILPVLVFGAGTDYALLLIARYREELRRHERPHDAMAVAIRQAGPAILASSGTVVIGLLCLLAAQLNSNQSLGPVGALGILAAVTAMMTLLPAILVIVGRRVFWPFVPAFGSESHEASTIWSAIGERIWRRPRPVWVGTVAVLAVMAVGLVGIDTTLSQEDQFLDEPDSITGQNLIAEHYAAGASAPTTVIANASQAEAVRSAIAATEGVAAVEPSGEAGDLVAFSVTLTAEPASAAAFAQVERLRDAVHAVPGADALVGGPDAEALDTADAAARDRLVVIPLVLVVVLAILAVLLRSLAAPLLLVATVVLSFAAALGVSVVVFDVIFGLPGVEPSVPLLGFVFLVALGVDYNIFLMSRVHEEAAHLGTRAGMLKGLSVTGGVITSAGIVLAATFAVLGVLPVISLLQVGFLVAFGVLLDTLVVRSVLVPALTFDLGRRVWWPSALSRRDASTRSAETPGVETEGAAAR